MSLMQQALDTYSYAEKKYAGVYFAGVKEPLAPIGHTITKAAVEITINGEGEFLSATTVVKDDEKTIFPVTEDSAGRTSKPVPHPLCEQIQYLITTNDDKYSLYLAQLSEWADSGYSHPSVSAVLKYVKKGTVYQDLDKAGIIKIDSEGKVKNDKDFVRWIVNGIDEESACWKNQKLHKAYIEWYQSLQNNPDDYCMITGELSVSAKQHAKGVVSLNGNAKIISANDSNGFTYRGRFVSDSEALNISYNTSQKAHNALRWIVANQGVYFGGRCFVCWNPQGKKIPAITKGIMARKKAGEVVTYTPSEYKKSLELVLKSWKSDFQIDHNVVTVAFDAATTGRLAVAFYSEMKAEDFVDRLAFWEETCCWINGGYGIQSPSLRKIVDYSFGTLRSSGFEVDDNISKQVMLQLVACRVEQKSIPVSIVRAIVQHAGNLQIVSDDKEHNYLRRDLLFTACAVIRKYHFDYFKEEWDMALEPDKKDRSYQFGRWMAIMEKIEKDTYVNDEKRETNIIRRQQAFVTRPYTVTVSVMGHLKNAYYPQLTVSGRSYYEKLIESIVDIISDDESNINKPLKDTYLLGYYLQKKELYTSKKENEED